MKKFLLPLVLSIAMSAPASAQQALEQSKKINISELGSLIPRTHTTRKQFGIDNSEIVSLQSKITGQAHELIILYPESYARNRNKTYPVLYFLDAYWDATRLASVYANLVRDKVAPEFIMVGLSYPDGTDFGRARVRDYTYTVVPAAIGSGKGDQFLEFVKTEVAPLIESTYRGDKENRTLAGASLGGLFTLGAALKDADFFTGYIALSPAVHFGDGALFDLERKFTKQGKPLKARMFISAGSEEPPQFREIIARFATQLDDHKHKGLELRAETLEGRPRYGQRRRLFQRIEMGLGKPYPWQIEGADRRVDTAFH